MSLFFKTDFLEGGFIPFPNQVDGEDFIYTQSGERKDHWVKTGVTKLYPEDATEFTFIFTYTDGSSVSLTNEKTARDSVFVQVPAPEGWTIPEFLNNDATLQNTD